MNFYPPLNIGANIIFITDDGNNTYLSLVQTYYITIFGNGNIPIPINLETANSNNNDFFGRPRIAGPVTITSQSITDYEIVVKLYEGGRHYF